MAVTIKDVAKAAGTSISTVSKVINGHYSISEETAERDRLRQEYIAAYRASLVSQLENTYIVEPDGTKHKLGKKP